MAAGRHRDHREPLGPRIVEFHRLFYHRVPTGDQVSALLRSAGLPR